MTLPLVGQTNNQTSICVSLLARIAAECILDLLYDKFDKLRSKNSSVIPIFFKVI